MAKGPGTGKNDKQVAVTTPSPMKKNGRKQITGAKLAFSPRTRLPQQNKVYVVGVQLGLVLIRTEKENSTDDAFTNDVNKRIEDSSSGVAQQLKIYKICSRRQSKEVPKPIIQTSSYHSQWFVSIIDESLNTPEERRSHVDTFISYLNETNWKFPQRFAFSGDETKTSDEKITGTWDMYLMNSDIVTILKTFFFDDFGDFLEDREAIDSVYGPMCSNEETKDRIKDEWIKKI